MTRQCTVYIHTQLLSVFESWPSVVSVLIITDAHAPHERLKKTIHGIWHTVILFLHIYIYIIYITYIFTYFHVYIFTFSITFTITTAITFTSTFTSFTFTSTLTSTFTFYNNILQLHLQLHLQLPLTAFLCPASSLPYPWATLVTHGTMRRNTFRQAHLDQWFRHSQEFCDRQHRRRPFEGSFRTTFKHFYEAHYDPELAVCRDIYVNSTGASANSALSNWLWKCL